MAGSTGTTAAQPRARGTADLVELLTTAQRRVAARVTEALAEDGGTVDTYRLLRLLAGGGRSMSELSAALQLPPASATRLADTAVDAALAYRLPDPADGRKVVLHLAEQGRLRLSRWTALVRAEEDALAASLGTARADTLRAALEVLAATR